MATGIIGPALDFAQLGATLSGAPIAPGVVMALQMINSSCSQIALHKQKSTQLVQRCVTLLNFINEQTALLTGMDATAAFDEVETVLSSVHRRVQKWANCGKVKRLLKSAQIARDLDKCHAEVNNAMERLHVANPVAMLRMQQRSIDMMQQHQASLHETLQQLLISPKEIERAVQQHISGGNAAYELMRVGQERLMGLREEDRVPSSTILSEGRQIDDSPDSSRVSSPIITVQNQIEQALLDLHRLTNIPPTIPILNNQVRWSSAKSVRSGLYSEIYEGRWLGGEEVALKTLRFPDNHSPKKERLLARFENEISVWSKLKHENVLAMYGIVTNTGPIHIVSPWQSDNVLGYRVSNPDVNPLNLLGQAASGLEYLHQQQIVHGNLKCNNLLVSEKGVVTLSDFGLTQALTDVVGKPAMVVISTMVAVRWQAPELNSDEDVAPTTASDVFAFGMTTLELLTMKPPYSHRARDFAVMKDLVLGVLPPRPGEPEAVPWVTDELWDTLNRCWRWKPEERILASELPASLAHASDASIKRQETL